MVVCQYFLKGDCRFGDKCRFEHPSGKGTNLCPYFLSGNCRYGDKCRNEHPRGGGSSGYSSGNFGQRSQMAGQAGHWGRSYNYSQNRFEALSSRPREPVETQHQTVSQIEETVKNDMEAWERSKQWPLSCYTYAKEEQSFPGLLDFSPEEIRLEAYTANTKGNPNAFEQGLKQLLSENHKRRLQLSRMTVSEIQGEMKKNTNLNRQERIAMDAGFSVHQGAGVFGNPGTSLSFGTGSHFQSSKSFGDEGSSNKSSIFGQASVSASTSGTLAGSSNNTAGQSDGIFGMIPASQPAPVGRDLFASAPVAQSSGNFSSPSKAVKDNILVSASINTSTDSLKSSMETTSLSVENSSKGTGDRQGLTCSEEDMQAFMADSFVLGKIPECPPPLELC